MPIPPAERHYYTTTHKGEVYVWWRVAMGSVDGPNVYGRLAALTGRMGQSPQGVTVMRNQVYTDDPC